jgi:type VI secretion system protein ImpJ
LAEKEKSMSVALKVLWSEGLTLFPQHLQQQDLYHEGRLHRTARSINANLWGIREAKWRAEELANDLLRADTLSLVFQDGELYDAPGADLLPPPIDLSALPSEETVFTFHAAMPMLKPYGSNLPTPDGHHNGARYTQTDAETPDLFSEAVGSNIAYLKKRLMLISDHEPLENYVHFPVIRLLRSTGGGFEIDASFMPPGVCIGGIAGLPAMLDNLLAKLTTKRDFLSSRQRQTRKDVFEFHSGDMAAFWMLHTIHIASAALADMAHHPALHPRQPFEALQCLAAGLLTFSPKYSIADFPKYKHMEPEIHFGKLDMIIRDLVDTVISSRFFLIPLQRDEQKPNHHRGKLDATKIENNTLLCLAVNADMPALELVAIVPNRFKVGSPDDVERLVVSSLPGVELVHMPQVPSAIPVRPNTYYFSIENRGDLYENMRKAQAISIYAPGGMHGLKLELIALSN